MIGGNFTAAASRDGHDQVCPDLYAAFCNGSLATFIFCKGGAPPSKVKITYNKHILFWHKESVFAIPCKDAERSPTQCLSWVNQEMLFLRLGNAFPSPSLHAKCRPKRHGRSFAVYARMQPSTKKLQETQLSGCRSPRSN